MTSTGRSLPLKWTLPLCALLLLPSPWLAAGDVATSTESGQGADWIRFRGPDNSAVSAERGLERAWPEDGPKVLWRRSLGEGFAGIAVRGEFLYTLFADDESEFLGKFRAIDGSEVWRLRLGEKFHDQWGNGPRSTPAVEGERIYVLASKGLMAAVSDAAGEVIWRRDLKKEYPNVNPPLRTATVLPPEEKTDPGEYGYSSSLLVEGELVIVPTGAGAGRSLLAVDKETGHPRWTALDSAVYHSSPLAVTIDGVRQVVQVMNDEVAGVDLTGKVLWRQAWFTNPSQPAFVPPNKIFVSTSFDIGGMMLEVRRTPEGFSAETLWRARLMRNTWSSPVYYKDRIYGFDHATLRVLSVEDGEMVWGKRGLGKGMVLIVDDLLVLLSDQGVLTLAEADAEKFEEKGRFKVLGGPTWTLPTPAQGKLFLRNHEEMVCLDLRG